MSRYPEQGWKEHELGESCTCPRNQYIRILRMRVAAITNLIFTPGLTRVTGRAHVCQATGIEIRRVAR